MPCTVSSEHERDGRWDSPWPDPSPPHPSPPLTRLVRRGTALLARQIRHRAPRGLAAHHSVSRSISSCPSPRERVAISCLIAMSESCKCMPLKAMGKPRPPIGGLYHPDAVQKQAMEVEARKRRIAMLLQIHEKRRRVVNLKRELVSLRVDLAAQEREAEADLCILDQCKTELDVFDVLAAPRHRDVGILDRHNESSAPARPEVKTISTFAVPVPPTRDAGRLRFGLTGLTGTPVPDVPRVSLQLASDSASRPVKRLRHCGCESDAQVTSTTGHLARARVSSTNSSTGGSPLLFWDCLTPLSLRALQAPPLAPFPVAATLELPSSKLRSHLAQYRSPSRR